MVCRVGVTAMMQHCAYTLEGLMTSSTIHWACAYPMASPFGHGTIVSPDGSFFVVVVDGWFAGSMVSAMTQHSS